MPRYKKSGKVKYLIISVVLLLVIATTIIMVYFLGKSSSSKPMASQYLKIVHTKSFGHFYNQDKLVKISSLGLNVTAVGGDASYIMFTADTLQEPYYVSDFHVNMGDSVEAVLGPMEIYTILNDEGKFPIEFDVGCSEAHYETITIYLNPEDIVGVHE